MFSVVFQIGGGHSHWRMLLVWHWIVLAEASRRPRAMSKSPAAYQLNRVPGTPHGHTSAAPSHAQSPSCVLSQTPQLQKLITAVAVVPWEIYHKLVYHRSELSRESTFRIQIRCSGTKCLTGLTQVRGKRHNDLYCNPGCDWSVCAGPCVAMLLHVAIFDSLCVRTRSVLQSRTTFFLIHFLRSLTSPSFRIFQNFLSSNFLLVGYTRA